MGMYDQLEGMEEILDDFVVETNELVEQLNEDILMLESGQSDAELVNRIFRAFHTIKGTSGFLNFTACRDLAHVAEDLLNKIRNGQLAPSADTVDVLLETVDWFKEFVSDVRSRTESEYEIENLVGSIELILGRNGKKKREASTEERKKQAEPQYEVVDIPEELATEFVHECSELVEILSNNLLSLEIETTNKKLIDAVFRAFHTLKGNSALLGLNQMSEIAHKSEDILNLIREEKLAPSSEVIDALLSSLDWIQECVADVKKKKIVDRDISGITKQLMAIVGVDETALKGKGASGKVEKADSTRKSSRSRIDQTIRVDVNRLDKLMNLAGELVLGKNRLVQVTKELNQLHGGEAEVDNLYGINNSLGFITTEIQTAVMQMRMLPISHVFRKFPRLVRDLAREQEKKVDLVISGEETELDRSVIESIGDPLVHLLRNAVDHGIEEPQERVKKGKPAKGTICLSAFQEGNHIVIEIEDDGAGIDREKVSRTAVERNLISPEDARSLSEREVINLIFKPGFSTAKTVTDLSGRGVGMDVVHSNISKLNGSVDIRTEVGKGSKFTIKLPLTLAILAGLVVRVWQELYIIPLISVLETLKLEKNMICSVKGHEVIMLRDSILPLIRLDGLFSIQNRGNGDVNSYVVVVASAESRLGLVVSELLGQEETVVKPLGQTTGKVPCIAGGTIRGDGRISLILDIPEMMEIVARRQGVVA